MYTVQLSSFVPFLVDLVPYLLLKNNINTRFCFHFCVDRAERGWRQTKEGASFQSTWCGRHKGREQRPTLNAWWKSSRGRTHLFTRTWCETRAHQKSGHIMLRSKTDTPRSDIARPTSWSRSMGRGWDRGLCTHTGSSMPQWCGYSRSSPTVGMRPSNGQRKVGLWRRGRDNSWRKKCTSLQKPILGISSTYGPFLYVSSYGTKWDKLIESGYIS